MTLSVREQLKASGIFRAFPEDARKRLDQLCRIHTLDGDAVIYHRGDEPKALHGVVDGAVKLIGESPAGKFFLYELVSPGQWFGEQSAIDGESRGQTAMTIGPVTIISLLRKDLMDLLNQQPELYQHFVSVLCQRLRRAGKALEETAFLPVGARMANTLLRMQRVRERHDIKLSQEEIAASLGVTRQSIYRILKEWQQQGWVQVGYGNVTLLQPEALQEWVSEFNARVR